MKSDFNVYCFLNIYINNRKGERWSKKRRRMLGRGWGVIIPGKEGALLWMECQSDRGTRWQALALHTERAVERGQWRGGGILTQTGGLMMNKKKKRSAHKGDRGTESEGIAKTQTERVRPFYIPQGWMKRYCKSGLFELEIYRCTHTQTHTPFRREHNSIYMWMQVDKILFKIKTKNPHFTSSSILSLNRPLEHLQ